MPSAFEYKRLMDVAVRIRHSHAVSGYVQVAQQAEGEGSQRQRGKAKGASEATSRCGYREGCRSMSLSVIQHLLLHVLKLDYKP